jgi:hypothetical protein
MTSPAGNEIQVPGRGELQVQMQTPPLGQATPKGPAPHPGVAAQSAPATLELRDIHLPADPPLWPPAPGWWLVSALFLVALALGGQRAWRAHRVQVRRRRILDELTELGARLGQEGNGAELAAGVSALLKRIALTRFDRMEVAHLTGTAWLEFLDRHGGGGAFAQGPGRVLADGPYAPTSTVEANALLDLAQDWARRNT